jgi:hypothetical protein
MRGVGIVFVACVLAAQERDEPPAGQSLFDSLVPTPVPFPFSKLLDRIGGHPQKVLIPLGRSLQRFTAAPQFFRFPRAVATFDELFLAYQEKGAVIEVLSYNEDAGRFEFELVKNYREGSAAHVEHARRSVCTACHQNQAPIFPRQLWDETNANPVIAHLLGAEAKDFYGFPVAPSADTPYAIDLAVHRANERSTYQLIWKKADPQERASWTTAMLRCRLTGACTFEDAAASLAAKWKQWWPGGLPIPNPEIADRNPVAILSREGPSSRSETLEFLALRQLTIEKQFEPSVRRQPLAVWSGNVENATRVLAGMASMFSDRDILALRRKRIRVTTAFCSASFRPSAIAHELIIASR